MYKIHKQKPIIIGSVLTRFLVSEWVSDCSFIAYWAIFQLNHVENKSHLNEKMCYM